MKSLSQHLLDSAALIASMPQHSAALRADAAVAAIAVNEEEQVAVIIVVDDVAGEFEPSIGKIIK